MNHPEKTAVRYSKTMRQISRFTLFFFAYSIFQPAIAAVATSNTINITNTTLQSATSNVATSNVGANSNSAQQPNQSFEKTIGHMPSTTGHTSGSSSVSSLLGGLFGTDSSNSGTASTAANEDTPSSESFSVALSSVPANAQTAWLSYDVYGVADDSGLAVSVNDTAAQGGSLVKLNSAWTHVRTAIPATWLKAGVNTVRFSLPANASFSYRIKQVDISVDTVTTKGLALVVNNATAYNNKVLIKGFVAGQGNDAVGVSVGGVVTAVQDSAFEQIVSLPSKKSSAGWGILVNARFANGQVVKKTIYVKENKTSDVVLDIAKKGMRVFAKKDALAETLNLGGASINLTSDAKAGRNISVSSLRDVDLPKLDATLVNVTKNDSGKFGGYRFLPHTKFNSKQTIKLAYDSKKLPPGFSAHDVQTYYFDVNQDKWIAVDKIEVDEKTESIISQTDHFTDYINAVAKTPDMPETSSLTPTSMKDIKAADPSSQVNLIEAPTANNSGDARLNYALQLPAGRNGIQPNVAISYSSAAANGWLGLGWNVSVPSVGIDTRWGVPRYDAVLESETYTFAGEQLAPVAHRAEPVARVSERQFYPRVEGAFNLVVRHGASPKNYWWEVTDKAGTRHWYGGNGNGVVDAAVLKTPQGNIAHWALVQSVDSYGNTVNYTYDKVVNPAVAIGAGGSELYIKQINYTGFNGALGKYTVNFARKAGRADVQVDARLGFKRVTADVLDKVTIKYTNNTVRSYQLNYVTGAFNKTLLSSVSQLDAKNQIFNTHSFNYFNDVQAADGSYQPFKPLLGWGNANDEINADFVIGEQPISALGSFLEDINFSDKASGIGGVESKSKGVNGGVTLGYLDTQLTCKSMTVGANYARSNAESTGLLSLVDMNGDGLPDKVMDIGGNLAYRPNLSGATVGEATFGEIVPLQQLTDFMKDKTKSTTKGFEINPFTAGQCGGAVAISLGRSKTKSTYTNDVYFSDVNGDGLTDVAVKGQIYFNHLDANGTPVFTTESKNTPNWIWTGVQAAINAVVQTAAELLQLKQDNPLHDTVRVWQAPYTGVVSINAPVALIPLNSSDSDVQAEFNDYTQQDGVRVAIQHKNDELWAIPIASKDYAIKSPTDVAAINVVKGDRIYFRTQSIDDGMYDQVHWNPVISYTNIPARQDANGLAMYSFSAGDDFSLSGRTVPIVSMPIEGVVSIKGDFVKPVSSDSLVVQIVKTASNGSTSLLMDEEMSAAAGTLQINLQKNVLAGDQLQFKVLSSTNINWAALSWKPVVQYESTNNSDINASLATVDGKKALSFTAVPEYSQYAEVVAPTRPVTISNAGTLTVVPQFSLQNSASGVLTLTLKVGNTGGISHVVNKQEITVTNGVSSSPFSAITANVLAGQQAYIELHSSSSALANAVVGSAQVSMPMLGTQTIMAGIYTVPNTFIFGNLYRGWGQFVYNGNPIWDVSPIDESVLQLDAALTSAPSATPNPTTEAEMDAAATNSYDPTKSRFVMMLADGVAGAYKGFDPESWLTGVESSATRLGEKNFSVPSAVPSENARAIVKITKTEDVSYSLGGVVGAGFTTGKSTSRTLSDFMDMNGDRYPDVLGETDIQYTDMLGRLTETSTITGVEEPRQSNTESQSVNISGGFLSQQMTKTGRGSFSKAVGTGLSMLSFGAGESDDDEQFSWIDVNGDGLSDRLYKNGEVALNLGYSLAARENWGYGALRTSTGKNFNLGGGFNLGASSISGGINLSEARNNNQHALTDVNSDGLPDIIDIGDVLSVRLNTGNGFANAVAWNGVSKINESASSTEGANVGMTGCIPLPLVVAKLCISAGANVSKSMNKELMALQDVDGDGYVDITRSPNGNDGSLTVQPSTIGRTNLLKTITRPMGSTIALGYHREGNTYAMPESKWVLDRVEVVDRVRNNGGYRFVNTFAYADGYYDRRERESYGFKTVVVNQHDTLAQNDAVYRRTVQVFNNDSYYFKGLLLDEQLQDATGKPWTQTSNTYTLKQAWVDPNPATASFVKDTHSAFVALTQTTKNFYENKPAVQKTTSEKFFYDAYGNVVRYQDLGDTGTADDVQSDIQYAPRSSFGGKYIVNVPSQIKVSGGALNDTGDSAGTLLRQRNTVANSQGDLTQITQKLNSSQTAVYDIAYDQYGNVNKLTRPLNHQNKRMVYDYAYDADVASYVTKVSDSYGYSSTSSYDYKWGSVLESVDLNGQKTRYTYDDVGRLSTITGPNEWASNAPFTLKMTYNPSEVGTPWARTQHWDSARGSDTMDTITLMDSLGRVIQTKKDGSLFTSPAANDSDVMIVSGRVEFDGLGRSIKAWYPTVEAKQGDTGNTALTITADSVQPTVTNYDVMDRALTVTLPDNAQTITEYGIGGDRDNQAQFETKVTDANGKVKHSFTDVDGSITAVKEYNKGAAIWTSYQYDPLNQLTHVKDDKGNLTTTSYDLIGRRVSLNSPDAGLTTYTYDAASNQIALQSAVLKAKNLSISYVYDFERLSEVKYPINTANNIKYTYGSAADAGDGKGNRAGRIKVLQDGTGAQELSYGKQGEVVKTIRTVVQINSKPATYIQSQTYDTWNRITSLSYPDGEVVSYTYNSGGLLKGMEGKKQGVTYNYVQKLGYDQFEQRVYLKYGNNTEMKYSYDPLRRRLDTLKTTASPTAGNRVIMDNKYGYDKLSNVLSISNSAPQPIDGSIKGGPASQTFNYDDLYRLTTASGSWKGGTHQHQYTLAMGYDSIHNITSKNQAHNRAAVNSTSWVSQKDTTYNNSYAYGNGKPHAASQIGTQKYTYDANGNNLGWTSTVNGKKRTLDWSEDNRLLVLTDGGSNYYDYDAGGERVLKNGKGGTTMYPFASTVINSAGRFTKHYFIESQRIVSKIGDIAGTPLQGNTPETLPTAGSGAGVTVDYSTITTGKANGKGHNGKKIPPGQLKKAAASGTAPCPGNSCNAPGQQNKATTATTTTTGTTSTPVVAAATTANAGTVEQFQYYYHPDHLGSSSYITDTAGEVYQHLEYFPFGESFVEETNTNRTPYLFTGKELDGETGLYYYGARYYDPKTSVWQSADPILSSYMGTNPKELASFGGVFNAPNLNLYAYSQNNPVVYTDKDGNETVGETMDNAIMSNISKGNHVRGYLYTVGRMGWNVFGSEEISKVADGRGSEASRVGVTLEGIGALPVLGQLGRAAKWIKGAEVLGKEGSAVTKGAEALAHGCSFKEGTLVPTPEGFKSIESLKEGDLVLSRNEQTGEVTAKPIKHVFIEQHDGDVRLMTLVNAKGEQEAITTSDEHPFFVQGKGWLAASQIQVNDKVLNLNADVLTIVGNQRLATAMPMYNFEIADFHTYAVTDEKVWVHNSCIAALGSFRSSVMQFGANSIKLDKVGMKHILERHHPGFWNGTTKETQSFLNKNLTIPQVEGIVKDVLGQNASKLRAGMQNGQMTGVVDGVEYTLGLKNGRVGQLYPNGVAN